MKGKRAIAATLLLFSGCTPPITSSICLPQTFTQQNVAESMPGEEVDLGRWWGQFNDPLLSSLVHEAICYNFDLRLARERVCHALALYDIAYAALLPQIDAAFAMSRNRTSQTISGVSFVAGVAPNIASVGATFASFFEAGFNAVWDLDIWGQNSDAVDAAFLEMGALDELVRSVHVVVTSEVARHYMILRAVQAEMKIVEEHIASASQLVDILNERFEAGFISGLDLYTATGDLEKRQSELPPLRARFAAIVYSMAVLLGRPPEEIACCFDKEAPIPTASGRIPLFLPLDLLCRRGDVRAAELRVYAAGARLLVAKKDFLPTISLGAAIGYTSGFLKELFKHDSLSWSIGGSLFQPIFHGGSLIANVAVRTSLQKTAALEYEKSIVTALQEVETTLKAYLEEQARKEALVREVAANKEARELAQVLYLAGKVDFIYVLNIEDDYFFSQVELVQSEERLMTHLIAVYRALGGGWEDVCCD